ncbi:hypothetical protein ACFVAJ_16420 [Agromyces sp. NPDC057679]|uniref:hypothetical protein n=1 Tax=Agromyces sp. NPDC057679 TaxID=3346207 RepID=UPI0036729BEE
MIHTTTLRKGGAGPDRTQFAGSVPTPAETSLLVSGPAHETLVDEWLKQPGKALPFGGRDRLVEALNAEEVVDDVAIAYWHRKVAAELTPETLEAQDAARVTEAVELLEQVGRKDLGDTVARVTSSVLQVSIASADGTSTASENDPRVQAGTVFDRVVRADGTVFERVRDGFEPYYPGAVRFQADRPLTEADVERFAQLAGYAHKSVLHSPTDLPEPELDSPFSMVFTNTSRLKETNVQTYIDTMNAYLNEGSPMRESAGNTRLIDPMENPPSFELYYAD